MTATMAATRPRVVTLAARRADPVLARFAASLPAWGHASDAKRADAKVHRTQAVAFRRLQPNARSQLRWLVLDVDRPGAEAVWAWADANLPPPSFTVSTVNPDGRLGNAHLVYELAEPVCRSQNARGRPLRYLEAVREALREGLGADPGYTGLLCKNPLHPDHHVVVFHDRPRRLGELARNLDLPFLPFRARKPTGYELLGRNCKLFEHTRSWAYGAVGYYRDGPNRTAACWRSAVLERVEALNAGLDDPLPQKEAETIAGSVARWVWNRYRGRGAGKAGRGKLASACAGKATREKQAIAGRCSAWPTRRGSTCAPSSGAGPGCSAAKRRASRHPRRRSGRLARRGELSGARRGCAGARRRRRRSSGSRPSRGQGKAGTPEVGKRPSAAFPRKAARDRTAGLGRTFRLNPPTGAAERSTPRVRPEQGGAPETSADAPVGISEARTLGTPRDAALSWARPSTRVREPPPKPPPATTPKGPSGSRIVPCRAGARS